MQHYSIQLIWSAEEKAYLATVPELPEIKVVCESSVEAVRLLNESIAAYLSEKENNLEPSPASRHVEAYSGQFRLRLPRALHAALVVEAEGEGVSLNTYVLYLLSDRHARQLSFKQAAAAYGAEIRETLQYVNELVSNETVSSLQIPAFSWLNDSSVTITHIQ
ncbi:MAG: toxin-antitoxin system HicB family antitoxin [Desulfobacterales bacterium]|jgi:predicted HicB family RNase H-like nuclease|nr:toxin-antitoxin system HicB family antitoxin [Desulfobacterales bacterium]